MLIIFNCVLQDLIRIAVYTGVYVGIIDSDIEIPNPIKVRKIDKK